MVKNKKGVRDWGQAPSWWIKEGLLKQLDWNNNELGRGAAKLAALKIYLTIVTLGAVVESENTRKYVAKLTYNRISCAAKLSRKLISEGLSVLIKLKLIDVEEEGRSRLYSLSGFEIGNWCKIPIGALWNSKEEIIVPLNELNMRNKIELYALKMYFYLLSIRTNTSESVNVSFKKISEKTGIPERYIPRAYTYLIGIRMLAYVDKFREERFPNDYYLVGGRTLKGRQ